MIRRYAAMAVLAAAILGLGLGCGKGGKSVEVKVTLDDQPLSGATVVFAIESGTTAPASGVTDDRGICRLKTGTSDTVPAGNYLVTITKIETVKGADGSDPLTAMKNAAAASGSAPGTRVPVTGPPQPKSLIPAKYGDPKQSGLTCKVPEEVSSGVKEFKLSSK